MSGTGGNGHDGIQPGSARLIEVIETHLQVRANSDVLGKPPWRVVAQFWTRDGRLLAEDDPEGRAQLEARLHELERQVEDAWRRHNDDLVRMHELERNLARAEERAKRDTEHLEIARDQRTRLSELADKAQAERTDARSALALIKELSASCATGPLPRKGTKAHQVAARLREVHDFAHCALDKDRDREPSG